MGSGPQRIGRVPGPGKHQEADFARRDAGAGARIDVLAAQRGVKRYGAFAELGVVAATLVGNDERCRLAGLRMPGDADIALVARTAKLSEAAAGEDKVGDLGRITDSWWGRCWRRRSRPTTYRR